jgi:hypothetical protein
MCVDEINTFNSCFVTFKHKQREARALQEKGAVPLGQHVKLTGDQMNEYLKKFPLSGRTKQAYFHPEFRPTHAK